MVTREERVEQSTHDAAAARRDRRSHGVGRTVARVLAAGGLALGLASPAGAQSPSAQTVRGQVPASPGTAALRAEMAVLQRREAEAAARLEHFVSTLARRELTPDLTDSLERLVERRSALQARLAVLNGRLRVQATEMQMRRELAASTQPEGWFGVFVETVTTGESRGGTNVLRSVEYPRVRSVEPGSPAARAGLAAGDQLIMIGGVDLRRGAFDTRTLEPGRTLPVRVRRDGREQDVTVTIAPRPRTFVSGVTMRVTTEGPSPARELARRPLTAPGETRRVYVESRAPQAVSVVSPAPATTPGGAPIVFYSTQNGTTVAGAEVLRLTADLRGVLGLDVRDGVFVVQVARSTPAERAGLRQGDVLLRAGGVTLTTPLVLQRAVAAAADAGAGGIRIELLRAKQPRTVEMRW